MDMVVFRIDQAARSLMLSSVGASSINRASHPGKLPNTGCFAFLLHSLAGLELSILCTATSTSQVIARSAEHGLHLTDSFMLPILHLLYAIDDEVEVDANVALASLTHTLPNHLIQTTDGRTSISRRIMQRRHQVIRRMLSGFLDHILQAVHSLVSVGPSITHPLVLVLGLTVGPDIQNSLLLCVTIWRRIILISTGGIVLRARAGSGKTCELHLATV